MDRALQTALVDMAATRERRNHVGDTDEEGEGEGGEGEEGEREGEEVKWIQEFVSVALPGSRHQVCVEYHCTYRLLFQKRFFYSVTETDLSIEFENLKRTAFLKCLSCYPAQ